MAKSKNDAAPSSDLRFGDDDDQDQTPAPTADPAAGAPDASAAADAPDAQTQNDAAPSSNPDTSKAEVPREFGGLPPVTLRAPAGVGACAVDGQQYDVDTNGHIHVDARHVERLLAHGCTY